MRKLRMIEAGAELHDLRIPPSNHLEKLQGQTQHPRQRPGETGLRLGRRGSPHPNPDQRNPAAERLKNRSVPEEASRCDAGPPAPYDRRMSPSPPAEVAPGIYQHFKGSRFEVIGTGRHSETEEHLVFYRKLYDDYSFWVRPLDMFRGSIIRDGYEGPRFTRVA